VGITQLFEAPLPNEDSLVSSKMGAPNHRPSGTSPNDDAPPVPKTGISAAR